MPKDPSQFVQLSFVLSSKNQFLQKLKPEDVSYIRQSRSKLLTLSKRFNVSITTIERIKLRQTYKNVL